MSKRTIAWGFLLLFLLCFAFMVFAPAAFEKSQNKVVGHDSVKLSNRALELHKELIVGDWHADSLLWNRDLAVRSDRGHVDIPRLQAGNVALQMFTTVTKSPAGQNYEENATDAADNITRLALIQYWPLATWQSLTERALFQASKLHDLVASEPSNIRLLQSQKDMTNFLVARKSNLSLVGALLGTEGSHALDGNIENIERLYKAGFRMMSLQHFFDNKLGGSLHGQSGAGLSDFGRQAVLKMQSMDIIVDVSHSSEQTVADVLAIARKPVVVSHTGFKGYCDSPRNINDALMQGIANQGGLIAVGFWDGAICSPAPKAIAAAIKYGVDLVGEDHVSLGSDYDGTVTTAFDVSGMAVLTQALMDAGLSDQQIRKVMGGNMLKFLLKHLPPS